MTDNWDYRFFERSEFECKCGCGKADMDHDFMKKLVNLRLAVKNPVIINSGFRCRSHNETVGGAENSPHLEGKAADISVSGSKAHKLIGHAEFCGFVGIGVSQKGDHSKRFIHLDTAEQTPDRPRPWIWSY